MVPNGRINPGPSERDKSRFRVQTIRIWVYHVNYIDIKVGNHR